ncbi:unnamed protein product [Polarella glacialis]|uniref:Uncharacterized protein n=1 Tax=Polarella glacialis TaxID=89957 RepID=A0A813JC42_POLGL|nr:unnamed protein product [Polarella glacialis]
MEATQAEIQSARNLSEKEAKYSILQRQKESAHRLYEQKQNLVNERVRLLQLEQEEREANELLDRALNLSVDEEVQRQIHEVASSRVSRGNEDSGLPRTPSPPRPRPPSPPREWEARESHLEQLRSELAEKRRSVEQLHAERLRQRQSKEEQRLLRELKKVEEEADQLRQRPESDVESSESGSGRSAKLRAARAAVELLPDDGSSGAPIPDAFDGADLQLLSHEARPKEALGPAAPRAVSRKSSVSASECSEALSEAITRSSQAALSANERPSPTGSGMGAGAAALLFRPSPRLAPATDASEVRSEESAERSYSEPFEAFAGSEEADAAEAESGRGTATPVAYGRSRIPSCSSSTLSSDDLLQMEEVEVVEGQNIGFFADEWVPSPRFANLQANSTFPSFGFGYESSSSSAALLSPPRHQDSHLFASAAALAEDRRFGVADGNDEDMLAHSGSVSFGGPAGQDISSGGAGEEVPTTQAGQQGAGPLPCHRLFTGGATVDISDPVAKDRLANEMVSVIMDELIAESMHVVPGGIEPELRHPKPLVHASLNIDTFGEDGGSSVDSEPAVPRSPSRGTRLPTPPEDGSYSSFMQQRVSRSGPSSSVAEDHSADDESSLDFAEERAAAAAAAAAVSKQPGPAPKDVGPHRPPSPPPDVRPTDPKSRQETAELITGDLLEMLLAEVLDELEEEEKPVLFRPVAQLSSAPAPTVSPSPLEDARGSLSVVSPPPQAAQGIDTSDAVLGPFLATAFQQLGVADESSTVFGTIRPMDEWFPAVLEMMQKREGVFTGRLEAKKPPAETKLRQEGAGIRVLV